MTPRENILRALRRQDPDYVPWGLDLCESLRAKLKEERGADDFYAYYQLPYRYIGIGPTRLPPQFDAFYPSGTLPADASIDEWGVGYVPANFAHFSSMRHPMESFTTSQEVWNFPEPDFLADYRWEGVAQRIQAVKDAGYLAVYSAVQVFEPAWYLRGLENMLIDLYEENEIGKACLERICRIQQAIAAKMAGMGIDMIVFGDDVGTQKSMMMSKKIWQNQIRFTMERCIAAAKQVNPDILAYYHSDGNILDIIPDLIEIGVDVLNPVQPECMDPVKIKEMYGNRLSFWGTIGTQTTMPFGSVKEVEETTRRMIETVGKGGGLVIAPTHLLEPEVPLENIDAFYRTVRTYGKYRPSESPEPSCGRT